MTQAAFFGDAARIARVYARGRRELVAARTDLHPAVLTRADLGPEHAGLEVLFTTWGMPKLSPEDLDKLPHLRAVFYAAGSVQGFARPLLERDITVVSAWQANGVPVAEYALAQILLAGKGYFRKVSHGRPPATPWSEEGRAEGNFGATVSLLGAGAIGRVLIGLLRPFHLQILVFDPYLSEDAAAQLGVEKVTLEDAFSRGRVVSNHLANLPQTVGMLHAAHFRRLRDGATFINTGRGQTVNEPDLVAELSARPSLAALLDVTHPEPPRPTPRSTACPTSSSPPTSQAR